MDLSSPMSSVIPHSYGPVLAVLARAGRPLSGRQVAGLVDGRVGRSRVNAVLAELTASGIVLCSPHPPALLYELNREHVAAPLVVGLADLRAALFQRMRESLGEWPVPPAALWVFGSAARGDGSVDSDIDVFVLRPDDEPADDVWSAQLDDFSSKVGRWTGNSCSMLEMTRAELARAVDDGHRIVDELRRDAFWIAGVTPEDSLHT